MIRTLSLMMLSVFVFAGQALAAAGDPSDEATFTTVMIAAGLFTLVVIASIKNAKRDHRD